MHTTSKYAQMGNSNLSTNGQPTGSSNSGAASSNYRKFQHRRIHT